MPEEIVPPGNDAETFPGMYSPNQEESQEFYQLFGSIAAEAQRRRFFRFNLAPRGVEKLMDELPDLLRNEDGVSVKCTFGMLNGKIMSVFWPSMAGMHMSVVKNLKSAFPSFVVTESFRFPGEVGRGTKGSDYFSANDWRKITRIIERESRS